jgi:hypothetical protein
MSLINIDNYSNFFSQISEVKKTVEFIMRWALEWYHDDPVFEICAMTLKELT